MSERLKQYWAMKQASLASDYIGSYNPIGWGIGVVRGLSKDDLTLPVDDLGYDPGVGISRLIRRLRRVRKESVPNKKRQSSRIFIQEPLVQLLSLASLPLIGAGIGAAAGKERFAPQDIVSPILRGQYHRTTSTHIAPQDIVSPIPDDAWATDTPPLVSGTEKGNIAEGVYADTKQTSKYKDPKTTTGILTGQSKPFTVKDRALGATIGGMAGFGAAATIPVVALLLAAARRKRTKGEQVAAEKRSLWMHAIPGYTTYENAKRLGASTHFEETPKERAARKAREAMENEK